MTNAERQKKFHAAHPERAREYARRWQEKNSEHLKIKQRLWRTENLVKKAEMTRKYRAEHPEHVALIRANQKEYKRRLREMGACISCGSKVQAEMGKAFCSDCRLRKNLRAGERRDRLSKLGICWSCAKNPFIAVLGSRIMSGSKVCERCYMRRKTTSVLGSLSGIAIVTEKLKQQNYRCAYTGELLILGVNDSLDHIIPASRYPEGRHDPNNLEWVTRSVNVMKWDRTPTEFMAIINSIAKHRIGSEIENPENLNPRTKAVFKAPRSAHAPVRKQKVEEAA